MKNLSTPEIDRYRIAHPAGQMPDGMRPWAGCFQIPFTEQAKIGFSRATMLRVIATRGGYMVGHQAIGELQP